MPQNARSDAYPDASGRGPDYSSLVAMRETRGYTVEQLSLTCGLAADEILDIENGKVTDPSKLRRIASALRLSPEAFLASAVPTPPMHGRSLT